MNSSHSQLASNDLLALSGVSKIYGRGGGTIRDWSGQVRKTRKCVKDDGFFMCTRFLGGDAFRIVAGKTFKNRQCHSLKSRFQLEVIRITMVISM